MKCPFCGFAESKVIDSRPAEEGATIEGEDAPLPGARITKADLYAAGLTGGADSRAARQRLLEQLDLPEHLSTNALLEVLNVLMTREAFRNLCK